MKVHVGDVVVSRFGNRWQCDAVGYANGELVYVLRNRPRELPDVEGPVYRGPLPAWASHVERAAVCPAADPADDADATD